MREEFGDIFWKIWNHNLSRNYKKYDAMNGKNVEWLLHRKIDDIYNWFMYVKINKKISQTGFIIQRYHWNVSGIFFFSGNAYGMLFLKKKTYRKRWTSMYHFWKIFYSIEFHPRNWHSTQRIYLRINDEMIYSIVVKENLKKPIKPFSEQMNSHKQKSLCWVIITY